MAEPLNAPIAIVDKRRPEPNKSEIMNIIGDIEGKNCVLVDDIIDTGITVDVISRLLQTRQPRSLKICALLDKIERHKKQVTIDYLGFEIPDRFVVGYGLDIDEQVRNLPYIATVDPNKYKNPEYKLHT